MGFPGGSVVKNRPANARDTDSIPDLGRFQMPQSNYAQELQLLSPGTTRGAPQGEASAPQLESGPRWPQLEKSPHGNKDPAQQK